MEREKLIVAIDFGTTYSGAAFCHSNQKELNDIEVVETWSNNGIAPKVPTEIRYVPGREPLWGAEVSLASERRQASNSAVIYNRFKLLLDVRGGTGIYRSPNSSRHDMQEDQIKLPPGKSAMSVTTDYLRLLYNELMNKLLRRRLPDTLDITPIRFIFTVPAIWGHQAQEATRYAAKQAGFCSRPDDTLSLVSEPEAAAMYVLKAMHEANFSRVSTQALPSLRKRDTFVVCDAGGGTVDLIAYEVSEVRPALRLREAAVGSGGKCGSSYIDEGFLQLLRRKIGPDFDNGSIWSKKDIGRGSALMNTFDSIKKSYGQTTNDVWYLELPVRTPDNEAEKILDNELEITAADMATLFEPVVQKVISLVRSQVRVVRHTLSLKAVSTIFLVGGFGESQYLYQRLVEWANRQQPRLTIVNPSKSWSAILRGAIVHELEPAVNSRRLRQHYGFGCCALYDPTEHDMKDTFICPFSGRRYVDKTLEWGGHIGDECNEEKQVKFTVYRPISNALDLEFPHKKKLYGSKARNAPLYSKDPEVYTIGSILPDFSSISLAELESAYKVSDGKSEKVYKLAYDFKMTLGSADATFEMWFNGRCIGSTRISHEL